MRIYVAHSNSFDYQEKLYKPLRASSLNAEHEFVLPHEGEQHIDTKEVIRNCDVVIAEVSEPSTGEGIELGWANMMGKPVVCIHESGKNPSRSLSYISNEFIIYSDFLDLLTKLEAVLSPRV